MEDWSDYGGGQEDWSDYGSPQPEEDWSDYGSKGPFSSGNLAYADSAQEEAPDEGPSWGAMGAGLVAGLGASIGVGALTGGWGFLPMLAATGIAGGFAQRGVSNLYDDKKFLHDQSLETAGWDTAAGMAFGVAGRHVGKGLSAGWRALRGGNQTTHTFIDGIEAGGLTRLLRDTGASDDAIQAFRNSIDDPETGFIGANLPGEGGLAARAADIRMRTEFIGGDSALAGSIAPEAGPAYGTSWLQKGREAFAGQSWRFKTPFRKFLNSEDPGERVIGEAYMVHDHLRERFIGYTSHQAKAIASHLTPEQLTKHGRDIFSNKTAIYPLQQSKPGTLVRGEYLAVEQAKKIYQETIEDLYYMKRGANVFEEVIDLATGSTKRVPLLRRSNYTYGMMNKEARGLDDAGLEAMLKRQGVTDHKTISGVIAARANPHKAIEFQAKKLPDELYEQDFNQWFARMSLRDVDVISNNMVWGQLGIEGAPMRGQSSHQLVQIPEFAKDTLEYLGVRANSYRESAMKAAQSGDAKGARKDMTRAMDYEETSKMHRSYLEQIFASNGDDETRMMAWLRAATSNVLLTKNWPLQAAEVWKGFAMSGMGGRAYSHGKRVMEKAGITAQDIRIGGATRSGFDELTGNAMGNAIDDAVPYFIRSSSRNFDNMTPLTISRQMDTFSRKFGHPAAISMVDRVARKSSLEMRGAKFTRLKVNNREFAGKTQRNMKDLGPHDTLDAHEIQWLKDNKVFSKVTLKEASEIYDDMPAHAAAFRLGKWADEVGDGYLPKNVYIDGAQALIARWHFTTGPGMLPEIFRHPWGAAALQYRTYLARAHGQFVQDVFEPIREGLAKETRDIPYAIFGAKRLARSLGFGSAAQTPAAIIRQFLGGRLSLTTDPQEFFGIFQEENVEDFARRMPNELLGSMGGPALETLGAVVTNTPERVAQQASVPMFGVAQNVLRDSAGMLGDILSLNPDKAAEHAGRAGIYAASGIYPPLGHFAGFAREGLKKALR